MVNTLLATAPMVTKKPENKNGLTIPDKLQEGTGPRKNHKKKDSWS